MLFSRQLLFWSLQGSSFVVVQSFPGPADSSPHPYLNTTKSSTTSTTSSSIVKNQEILEANVYTSAPISRGVISRSTSLIDLPTTNSTPTSTRSILQSRSIVSRPATNIPVISTSSTNVVSTKSDPSASTASGPSITSKSNGTITSPTISVPTSLITSTSSSSSTYGNSSTKHTSITSHVNTTTIPCSTLSPGEPSTVWQILPNTNTITLTQYGNGTNASMTSFSSMPEFTPPTYCQTTSTEVSPTVVPGTSEKWEYTSTRIPLGSHVSSPPSYSAPAATSRGAVTVVTTSKNPIYETTTVGDLGYPNGPNTQKVKPDPTPTDDVNWGPAPFPGNGGTSTPIPINPGSNPNSPGTPNNPGSGTPNNPSTPNNPTTPNNPSTPNNPDTPNNPSPPNNPGSSNPGTNNGGSGSKTGDGSGAGNHGGSGSGSNTGSGNGGTSNGNNGGSNNGGGGNGAGSNSGGSNNGAGSNSGGSNAGGSNGGGSNNNGAGSGNGGSSNPGNVNVGGNNGGSNGNQNGATPTTATIGRVPVVVEPTQVVIGTQTISIPDLGITGNGNGNGVVNNGPSNGNGEGGRIIVESGQTFTVNPSRVIGAGSTINIPTTTAGGLFREATPTVIYGVPVQLGEKSAVISGTTYSIGSGAPETTIVVNGQTISIGPGGLGFAQTTVPPNAPLPTNIVIIGGQVFSAIGNSLAVVGASTITYGPAMPAQTNTFNGAPITLGPQGIFFDGGKSLGGAANPSNTQLGIAGGLTISEIGSSVAVINGVTFTLSPNLTPITTVINGKTVTINPSGIDLGSTTLAFPFNPTTRTLTAGGVTYTEIGGTLVVLGGTTYTAGPGAKPTTGILSGQRISIGPNGVGFASTTIPLLVTSSTPTAGADANAAASAKSTSAKSGAGVTRPMSGVLGLCMVIWVGYMI